MASFQRQILLPVLCSSILLVAFDSADGFLVSGVRSEQRIDEGLTDSCDIKCNTSAKYRTYDGSCNNLKNPCWGKSYRTFNYLLPPRFADNIGCPTIALPNTQPLPQPRRVSSVVHYDKFIEAKMLSQVFTTFGQFQAHDTGLSPVALPNEVYNCPQTVNEVCRFGIEIPPGDKYLPINTCADYAVTSKYSCDDTGTRCGCSVCKPGQWIYVNAATSFHDGSTIYGSNEDKVKQLRQPGTAYLKMDGDQLSRVENPDQQGFRCATSTKGCDSRCFNSGDLVTSLNFPLTAMYSIWFKEHNRLVDKLRPYFSDNDVLFNEVRKIVIAMVQHIQYSEYLPLVFGTCMPSELKVPFKGRNRYDPTLDPTTLSECNFAACRYGHSEIKGFPKILGTTTKYSIGNFGRLDMFCLNNSVNRIIGGLTEEKTMELDEYITSEVLNKMSYPGGSLTDLIATGIKRSRSAGVSSYIEMFENCGLKAPKNYDELKKYIADEAVTLYRQVYGEQGMANIDLYSAILSEKPLPGCGGILGQITQCIVSEHHRRAKLGDRLWYENLDQPESLTKSQVREIQKTTMSRLICSNSDLKKLQKRAFEIDDFSFNPKEECRNIISNDIDASKWKK